MKVNLAFGVGILALAGLLGVTVAEMQTATPQAEEPVPPAKSDAGPSPELAAPAVSGELPAPTVSPPAVERAATGTNADSTAARELRSHRARGLYIRPDGNTIGRVSSIEHNTLRLMPVRGALVSFLQDSRIVAQGVTDEQGMFAVQGLTPWGVYSVTTSSQDFVCMFATVIRPVNLPQAPGADARSLGERAGVTPGWVNEIRFVSMLQPAEDASTESGQSAGTPQPAAEQGSEGAAQPGLADDGGPEDYLDYELHEFQLLPREDFLAALRGGLFGPDAAGAAPGGAFPGAGGGMGGCGGGGGGGGGGGLGAGLIGAGIGAGVGAAIGASQSDNNPASPFQPPPQP